MIPFAIAAGVVCLLVVGRDVWQRAGEPYATMRLPVAGVWAVAWLSYGFNSPDFPSPAAWSLVVMATGCLGALLSCPVGYVAPDARPFVDIDRPWFDYALLGLAVGIIVWDIYFVVGLVDTHGVQAGLSQHRLDRGVKEGAWALPGLEVIHAAITAAGALGYARWRRSGRWPGAVLALAGLVIAFLSTGRWDVVAYVVWLLAIHAFTDTRRGLGAALRQGVVYGLLGVYFVAQGQLFGKVDLATSLANASPEERAAAARDSVQTVRSGSRPLGDTPDRVVVPSRCERWQSGATAANLGFRRMSSVERVLVLYFAGPLATLDRALCEGAVAERPVLMYWPFKIARTMGLMDSVMLPVVDPFLDIGIPFNNYTVIYQFLTEVGPRAGLVVWVVFGVLVGLGSRRLIRTFTVPGLVAGTAPLAIAIRTPWTNSYFDGTLLIWIAVALSPLVLSQVLRVVGRGRADAPAS